MRRHVNLLPQSFRRRQLIRQRLVFWSAVWSLGLALGCILFWGEFRRYQAGRALLRSRQAAYAPIEKMLEDGTAIRQRIQDLQQREALALKLADEQPLVLVLGVVSRAATESAGELFVEHLALNSPGGRRAAGAARSGSAPSRDHRLLTLEGLAVNQPAVLSLVDHLRMQAVFERVELKSCVGVKAPGGRAARSYRVECVF